LFLSEIYSGQYIWHQFSDIRYPKSWLLKKWRNLSSRKKLYTSEYVSRQKNGLCKLASRKTSEECTAFIKCKNKMKLNDAISCELMQMGDA